MIRVLDEMCLDRSIHDMDDLYHNLYYPMNERLRDRGNLTLLKGEYCKQFKKVLDAIKEIVKPMIEKEEEVILKKEKIVRQLNDRWKDDSDNPIAEIINLVVNRNTYKYVTEEILRKMINELINKVLNAYIGRSVKRFREKALARVNTVAFRTELSVKSEKI